MKFFSKDEKNNGSFVVRKPWTDVSHTATLTTNFLEDFFANPELYEVKVQLTGEIFYINEGQGYIGKFNIAPDLLNEWMGQLKQSKDKDDDSVEFIKNKLNENLSCVYCGYKDDMNELMVYDHIIEKYKNAKKSSCCVIA